MVIVGYAVINFVQDQFLQPVVMGSQLNLSPLVVFIALVAWAWILGPVGALLAVPLTLGLVAVLEAFPSSRPIASPVPQQDRVERRDPFPDVGTWERPRTTASDGVDATATPALSRRAIVRRAAVLVGIIVVVFGVVLPRLVDYEAVRAAVAALTLSQVALLGVTSLVAYVASSGPSRVLVPGLSWPRAVGSDLAARAVVSTVPGPTDAATRFVLYRQWSIPTDAASAGIGLAALFETLSCFALPLIALPGLMVLDHPTRSKALVLALIGVAVLAVAVVLLVSVVRSDGLARRLGGWLDALATRIWTLFRKTPPSGIVEGMLELGESAQGHADAARPRGVRRGRGREARLVRGPGGGALVGRGRARTAAPGDGAGGDGRRRHGLAAAHHAGGGRRGEVAYIGILSSVAGPGSADSSRPRSRCSGSPSGSRRSRSAGCS